MTTDTSTFSDEPAFSFLRTSHRPSKPRTRGITEIRGPDYTVMGPRYLQDMPETMGAHVDALKLAGLKAKPKVGIQFGAGGVVATIARELGLEKVMFEAADPEVFKNDRPEVNLFVDHSQVVQLERLRCGIWGTKSLWGRVVTYPGA